MSTQLSEFDRTLIESIDEGVRGLFSQEVVDALHSNLINKESITLEALPEQLQTLHSVLERYFGLGALTLERTIARNLYSKLGLVFHAVATYQLENYVENARGKSKPALPTSQPRNVNLPLKDDWDRLLVESVREGIEDALGKDSAKLAFRFLERDVTFDKLPRHLPTFYSALKRNFGEDYPAVEAAIAKKLYVKLCLQFTEIPNADLGKYVEEAYVKLSLREKEGFFKASARPQGD
jgi:hypothetical protein